MTTAAYSRPHRIDGVDAAAEILRARGHRVSAMRRMVIEGLVGAEGPVSAELLCSRIEADAGASDLASVYRSLELLEDLGLVRHVHIGHGPGLYALAGDSERPYVVCEHCHEISRLPEHQLEAIRASIERACGYEAHFSHFPILGLCPACVERRDLRERGEPTDHEGGTMSHHHDDEEHEHSHGHSHEESHSHEHSHGDVTHSHAHDEHEHEHVEHAHEHSHGDRVHSHPHVHQQGLEDEHEHSHEE